MAESPLSPYRVPAATVRAEIEVKRSRFIASVGPAENRAQADAFIAAVRAEFSDATHNAFACIAGSGGAAVACSDDGEVAGTAGRPMLQLLQHSELFEVVAVVTRYYGGTLLGTGGLQRAYSQVLKEALALLPTIAAQAKARYEIRFDFALEAGIRRLLLQHAALILSQTYGDVVSLHIELALAEADAVQAGLQALSRGQVEWRAVEEGAE